jgi:hypothetical protein
MPIGVILYRIADEGTDQKYCGLTGVLVVKVLEPTAVADHSKDEMSSCKLDSSV